MRNKKKHILKSNGQGTKISLFQRKNTNLGKSLFFYRNLGIHSNNSSDQIIPFYIRAISDLSQYQRILLLILAKTAKNGEKCTEYTLKRKYGSLVSSINQKMHIYSSLHHIRHAINYLEDCGIIITLNRKFCGRKLSNGSLLLQATPEEVLEHLKSTKLPSWAAALFKE